jgi:hypothetical protein
MSPSADPPAAGPDPAATGAAPDPSPTSSPAPSPAEAAPQADGALEGESPAPSSAAGLWDLALTELQQRRRALLEEISGLEQQRQRLLEEIAANPEGQSEQIAKRLKGFQAYLVGALQDLAMAAEQQELVVTPLQVQPSPLDQASPGAAAAPAPPAAAGLFREDAELIRGALARYGGQPDFYADPWKLRRTLEPAGAALLDDWFLNQGGRGAQPSSGSRNRNVLIAAAAIAILGELYGERFQTLVLAGQPERLGEWRRGLQDCLGLGREDFGPTSGIVLFERPEALIERADRLEERGELPFIVVDAGEGAIAIPVLQFPLWLAFAATPGEIASEEDLY